MEDKIQVKELNFWYNNYPILKGVNFSIEPGDFVGIVGPNGSGKTTLLKNITGYLTPQSGRININGKDIKGFIPRDLALEMAVVPQETKVDFDFTVEEIVWMGRNPHISRFSQEGKLDREKVFDAMEKTGIYQIKDKLITSLSGGERQRVIIARALAQDTGIILLDEPTSHQDINNQVEIMELLTTLNLMEGITIVAVLHDLNLAAQYCQKLIIMKEGYIHRIGPPNSVITEETIKDVYNREVLVGKHPWLNCPQIFLIPSLKEKNKGKKRIHVISGGGMGTPLIITLSRMGYPITLGAVNIGDSDWHTGNKMGIDMVQVPPFSPMKDNHGRMLKDTIKKSELVILTSVPFGRGNLMNLEILKDLVNDIELIIIEESEFSKRDFTGGIALQIYNFLKTKARVVKKNQEVIKILEKGVGTNG